MAWQAWTVKGTVPNEMTWMIGDPELDTPGVRCFHPKAIQREPESPEISVARGLQGPWHVPLGSVFTPPAYSVDVIRTAAASRLAATPLPWLEGAMSGVYREVKQEFLLGQHCRSLSNWWGSVCWIMWKWKLLSHVWLFVTPWTIESMEFSRPESWCG